MTDFGESWVTSPIERWATILMKSGILFVLGGLAAWAYDNNWKPPSDLNWFRNDAKAVPTLLFLFGLLVVMATASSILKHFDLLVLRLLEGYYWPKWLRDLEIHRQNVWWFKKRYKRLQELGLKPYRSPKEEVEFAQLDEQLMFIPREPAQRMPTRLGNFLRAIESRPKQKYGLNAVVCWPRLWLVLPTEAKHELANARDNLDTMVRTWNWSLLFMVWSVWAWEWVIPLGLTALLITYRWILQAAQVYGQLVESSFDLYRFLLYNELHWPLPQNSFEEKKQGKQLTEYLWRGSEEENIRFFHSQTLFEKN
ncbi:hypothetical protein [Candidatus Parabeggiatoa sp. HSG14]|uniref:hypothetical protein n=1 Tax=Candidatus Parabeggiatoa sp. HSG14 TaxID=3055593 RepID=UPI0025A7F1AA|nr:hypothetical protein [Thiotrichales bacterium HSG14]